jgi:hypothetical protein
MQDAELISSEAKAFKDDRAVAAGRRSQSAAKKQKPGPEMPTGTGPEMPTKATLSFGVGSERRSARQLVELSQKGWVKL